MHQNDGMHTVGIVPDAGQAEDIPADGASGAEHARPRLTRLLPKDGEDETRNAGAAMRRPDAWLERRLRVFERSVEILETQQKEIRAEHRAALVRMDESMTQLKENLTRLQSESENALPELQSSVRNMRFRLDVVEAVASAALEGSNPAAPAPESPAAAETPFEEEPEPVFVPDEIPPARENADAEAPAPEPRDVAYLEFARRRANEAAEEAKASAITKKIGRAQDLAHYNRRLLTGIGIGALLFAASAGVSFHQGYLDGRAHAAENHSIKHKTVRKAAHAPSGRLHQLAQAGNRDAQLLLALKFHPARGEVVDPLRARYWMMKAAEAGQPMAQYLFAKFEERGVAAPADMTAAIKWYETAAWAGNRKAMNDLAVIFAQGAGQGVGVKTNPEEAALWFYRAADNGLPDAQFNLAVLYERGLGVPQSPIHAYKWYSVAAEQGDLFSRKRLGTLDGQMSEEDLRVAHRLVARFEAKAPDLYANMLPDEAKIVGEQKLAAR